MSWLKNKTQEVETPNWRYLRIFTIQYVNEDGEADTVNYTAAMSHAEILRHLRNIGAKEPRIIFSEKLEKWEHKALMDYFKEFGTTFSASNKE